jgi:hypothetical protein
LFGECGDELAAEGRDIRDHAAPDQEKGVRDKSEYVYDGLLAD